MTCTSVVCALIIVAIKELEWVAEKIQRRGGVFRLSTRILYSPYQPSFRFGFPRHSAMSMAAQCDIAQPDERRVNTSEDNEGFYNGGGERERGATW